MGWQRAEGTEQEFQGVRALLVRSEREAPLGHNWDTRRWEGRRFYSDQPGGNPAWHRDLYVWRADSGAVLAAVHPEGEGWALQVAMESRDLEEPALTLIEERAETVEIEARESDSFRPGVLERRGYRPTAQVGYVRRMAVPRDPPRPSMPSGYTLRPLDPERDAAGLARLLNAAFGRDFHGPEEYLRFTEQAPTYVRDLDLGAFTQDGTLAAYAAVPFVREAQRGIYEPVCTHPEHRGRGLASRLMQEGLVRLAAMQAIDVIVATGDMPAANALYDRFGFTEKVQTRVWRRERT